jgi:hypothetical protein
MGSIITVEHVLTHDECYGDVSTTMTSSSSQTTLQLVKDADSGQHIGRIGSPLHAISFRSGKLKSDIDVILTAIPGSPLLAYPRQVVPHTFGQLAVDTTHLPQLSVSHSKIIFDLLAGRAWPESF